MHWIESVQNEVVWRKTYLQHGSLNRALQTVPASARDLCHGAPLKSTSYLAGLSILPVFQVDWGRKHVVLPACPAARIPAGRWHWQSHISKRSRLVAFNQAQAPQNAEDTRPHFCQMTHPGKTPQYGPQRKQGICSLLKMHAFCRSRFVEEGYYKMGLLRTGVTQH